MTKEEELENLRANGWKFRRLENYKNDGDEWYEILESPERTAGEITFLASLLSCGWQYNRRFLGDLPEWARDEPHSLAGHLFDYAMRHNLNDAELGQHLGCDKHTLREVAHAPVPALEDAAQTAAEAGCSVEGLERILREQKRPPLAWLTEGGEV